MKMGWLVLAGVVWAGVAGCGAEKSEVGSQKSDLVSEKSEVGTAGAEANREIRVPRELPAVTLHLAGDSTVSNYAATTVQEGWGMEIGQFFNEKVMVNNVAVGGANIQTFKAGNWKKLMAAVKPGDFVMIQFGANDSGTAHGPVRPPEFAATLETMAEEVKAKGATPIFVTPSAFYDWSGGKENNVRLAPYGAACYEAGKATGGEVDDLNARGVEWLNTVGAAEAKGFYLPNSQGVPDKAHFVKAGAVKMAEMVAEELRRIKSPLAEFL